VPNNIILLLNALHAMFEIELEVLHVHRRNEQPKQENVSIPIPAPQNPPIRGFGVNLRSVCKQIIHLLERPSLRLRLESPEVQGVCEVANDEEQVKAPADAFHGDRRHLTDHGVESEGDHDSDRDAFAAGFGVEDFGGDDP
jgi:hypothetical protein